MSIRLKILTLFLGFMGLLGGIFLFYAFSVGSMYQELCVKNVSQTVMIRSEMVNKNIARLEQSVLDSANTGKAYYLHGIHAERNVEKLPIGSFYRIDVAVGGGIWFEPYKLFPDQGLFSVYALNCGNGEFRIVPLFNSEEYNYPNQLWYRQIKEYLVQHPRDEVCWSQIYYDKPGTDVWIKTVGAGIYDEKHQLIGMATVDWKVARSVRLMSGLQFTENSFVTLIDGEFGDVLLNTSKPIGDVDVPGNSLSKVDTLPWYSSVPKPKSEEISVSRFRFDDIEYFSFGRELDNGMYLFVQIPCHEMNEFMSDQIMWFTVGGLISILLITIAVLYMVTVTINRPLDRLMEEMSYLGKGHLDSMLVEGNPDEFGQIAATYNQTTANLKDYIESVRKEATIQSSIHCRDDVARGLRQYFLPEKTPYFSASGKFSLYAGMKAGTVSGGDYYGYRVCNNWLYLMICDASDLSIDASMLILNSWRMSHRYFEQGMSPGEIVNEINRTQCRFNETSLSICFFMGAVNLDTGKFLYCGTGHLPPLIKRTLFGEFEWLPASNPKVPFGVHPETELRQRETQLKPGDELFFCTDGITEALDPNKVPYHASRLKQTLNTMSKTLAIDQVADYVWNDQKQYTGKDQPDDDTSFIIVRFHP